MNLLKSLSIYAVNNIINASIPFLLLPVLTAHLSPDEYGVLSNAQVFITFTLPFILLATHGAVNTAYFREKKEDFPAYISSSFLINIAGALFSTVVLFIAAPLISESLEIPFRWIMIIPVICLFQTVCMVTLVVFQARKQPVKYGIFQICMTLLNFGGSVLFVVTADLNWEGRLLGILVSFTVFMIIGLISLRRLGYLRFTISKKFLRDALLFGLPLIPHMIGAPLIQLLDRPLITHFIDTYWAGLYTVAFQLGVSVNFIADAFNKAWVPHMFENLSNINPYRSSKIVKQSYLFMLLFLILPVLLYMFTPLIFDWFIDPQYHEVKHFVLPISFGAAFGGMYYVVANYIFFTKKTWLLAIVTFMSAIFSFILNIVFIPRFGAVGAAYTNVIINFLMFVSVWIISARIFPMPWLTFWKKI